MTHPGLIVVPVLQTAHEKSSNIYQVQLIADALNDSQSLSYTRCFVNSGLARAYRPRDSWGRMVEYYSSVDASWLDTRGAGDGDIESKSSFVVCTAIVVDFFANMLPIKTVIDETRTFAEYLGQFRQSLIVCLSKDEVAYEDIVAQAESSSSGRGYFKHLFALGGMNVETISQLEFHHLRRKSTTSVPNGEEQYEFLHPRNGHVILDLTITSSLRKPRVSS
ncbi:hypothetical protein BU15DRAFT_76833 [Melanogaster broomeanus]|nr:hypothetical protein BU15DRAFT_76833 [Melanogaster broomeanus]